MLGHANFAPFSGGFVGVDVFFVISGYLITGLLARELATTGRVSIASFYARRARRILPASTVVLLVIALAATAVYTAGDLSEVLTGVRWSALFGENIHLARARTDYFAENSFVSPVQHFWSLAVEEQFYLVWPALIGAILRWTTRGGRRPRRGAHLATRRSGTAIGAIALLSFAWSVWDTSAAPASAYYSTFTRAWELAIGALLALGSGTVRRLPGGVKAALSWGGLLAIGVAVHEYGSGSAFPGYAAALPVLGAAAVLAGGIDGPAYGAQALLRLRPFQFLGDISYSLYLWHWPLLVMPPVYLGRPVGTTGTCGLVLGAVVVSWLSYRWIERPVQRLSFIKDRTVRSLALWPGAVAALLACAALVQLQFITATPAGAVSAATPEAALANVRTSAMQAQRSGTLPTTLVGPPPPPRR